MLADRVLKPFPRDLVSGFGGPLIPLPGLLILLAPIIQVAERFHGLAGHLPIGGASHFEKKRNGLVRWSLQEKLSQPLLPDRRAPFPGIRQPAPIRCAEVREHFAGTVASIVSPLIPRPITAGRTPAGENMIKRVESSLKRIRAI